MKTLTIIFFTLVLTLNLFGQDSKVEELVSEGTALHDQGKYDEAIAKYKEALEINPESPTANYEMSYSCFATKKYEDAIRYSKKIIDMNSSNIEQGWMILGSSYNELGDYQKAVQIYKQGLEKLPKSNLLNYSLALIYYNKEDYKNAENSVSEAILLNPKHANSHFLLASIMIEQNLIIKTIFPMYNFLLMNPNSERSKIVYEKLIYLLGKGVEQNEDSSINIQLSDKAIEDKEFRSLELALALKKANNLIGENKNISELELFNDTNKTLFTLIKESNPKSKGEIWDYYLEKFKSLAETNNIEAFSYFISYSVYPEISKKWFIENPDKFEKFKNWMIQ